ncbi:MAG: aminoglycoside phosphotransferase family protein [Candidatus Micrarchaeales archaeon]|nr:aminoglycoside phosphotransferase family protein [Candidatus Micrarchaeales archaeon]
MKLLPTQNNNTAVAEAEIRGYLENLSPAKLGLTSKVKVSMVKPLGASGERHLNYKIMANRKAFLLRISLNSKKILRHLNREYSTLKRIEKFNISPRAYIIEKSKTHLGTPFIVLEFIEGKHPDGINDNVIRQIAVLNAELHAAKIDRKMRAGLRHRRLDDIFGATEQFMYDAIADLKANKNTALIRLLQLSYERLSSKKIDFTEKSDLIHSDIALENIIQNSRGIFLIDWETAAIGDPCIDIATTVDRLALNSRQEKLLVKEYLKLVDDENFAKRYPVFLKARVFNRLCWVLRQTFGVKYGRTSKYFPKERSWREYEKFSIKEFGKCRRYGAIPRTAKWKNPF